MSDNDTCCSWGGVRMDWPLKWCDRQGHSMIAWVRLKQKMLKELWQTVWEDQVMRAVCCHPVELIEPKVYSHVNVENLFEEMVSKPSPVVRLLDLMWSQLIIEYSAFCFPVLKIILFPCNHMAIDQLQLHDCVLLQWLRQHYNIGLRVCCTRGWHRTPAMVTLLYNHLSDAWWRVWLYTCDIDKM